MSAPNQRNDCGCCEGLQYRTPLLLLNRPGLPEIEYRLGTYGTFKQSMLAGLSSQWRPGLAGLRTRSDEDFSIALIDAWAVVGDVLTFYIERTAQEHYLPTATERRSVDDLVKLINYRLRPGVAASTWLAFTLESSPDADNDMRPKPSTGVPERSTIRTGIKVESIPGPDELPQAFETVEPVEAIVDWNRLQPRMSNTVYPSNGDRQTWLDGIGLDIKSGDSLLFMSAVDDEEDMPDSWDIARVTRVQQNPDNRRTLVRWIPALTNLSGDHGTDPVEMHVLRQRGSLFGYNAPNPLLFHADIREDISELLNGNQTEWEFEPLEDETLHLDTVYQGIEPGSWAVVQGPETVLARVSSVSEVSKSGYGISAKVTEVVADAGDNDLTDFGGENTRTTILQFDSEMLTLAEYPIEADVTGDTIELGHSLANAELPRPIVLRGIPVDELAVESEEPDSALTAEDALVIDVQHEAGIATLVLESELNNTYERSSVEILGNVARATHGERIQHEVLGSGSGTKSYQKFALQKGPLTYIRGEKPGTIESTLEVFVNDMRWTEVDSFFGTGPRDRVYMTRISDDGKTTVNFGNGLEGARLPTGDGNVTATYRHGSGPDGEVETGQLSLLMSRPLGVRGVENPVPADGASARQSARDARSNAPRAVITLDRIVSLRDFEDFAREFPGIEKAAAVHTWDGQRKGVLITVAGVDGETVDEGSTVHTDLAAAIDSARPGNIHVVVRTYRPVLFKLHAELRVDSAFQEDLVFAEVRTSLSERFSFSERAFGQLVKLSDLYSAIHRVKGVEAARIIHLYLGEVQQLEPFLAPETPVSGVSPDSLGAELLLIDPASLDDLEVVS